MKRNIILVLLLSILFVSCKKEVETTFEYTKPEVKTSEFTDLRDNTVYKCVEVNGQVWMAENFRYKPKANSFYGCYSYHQEPKALTTDNISKAITLSGATKFPADLKAEILAEIANGKSATWILIQHEKVLPQIFFDRLTSMVVTENPFDENYYKEYGLLYSYSAALRYAPEGWRLPTDEDWAALEKSLGMPSEEVEKLNVWRGDGLARGLKEGDDGIGFNVKYSGARLITASGGYGDLFFNKGANAYFWSSTIEEKSGYAIIRSFFNRNDAIMRSTSLATIPAYSIRYIKN